MPRPRSLRIFPALCCSITNEDQLLVYDESDGQFVASARVWWTFRVKYCYQLTHTHTARHQLGVVSHSPSLNIQVFGHTDVKVLAGGLKNWPRGLQIQKTAAVRTSSLHNVHTERLLSHRRRRL